jgi:uncharacterized membrane protein YjjP (DUF1212 family)
MSRPDAPARSELPTDSEVELLLEFAQLAHRAGYPTSDLEERLGSLAAALGLEAPQISATPTLVELSFGSLSRQRSYTLRVRPTGVDLDAIGRLEDLARAITDGQITPGSAIDQLAQIDARPLERRWYVALAAYALAGGAVAPVLGGGWNEVAAAGAVGLLVGAVAELGRRASRAAPMVAPLAAVVASFSAAGIVELGLKASPDTVTLAALITFLPGMALTIGVRELATEHLQSGVANTANAIIQLLGLVFGVAVGRSLATHWFGIVKHPLSETGFTSTHLVGALAAGLAFTVTLRAPYKAAPVMCAATLLAVSASAVGRSLFGSAAGTFVAALSIGTLGALLAAPLRRPPLVFIVPGVLMLVPGSAGFNSLLQLLTGQTVSGIEAGFNAFVTAMAISYGLMVSTVIVPPRLSR